jgi:hypothetical protein
MITDAPYDPGQSAITIRTGFIAGLVGAGVMALVVSALNGAGFSIAWLFAEIGSVFVKGTARDAGSVALVVGVLVHAGLGGGFGMLYASSLRRQAVRAIVAIAISYGILLWIIPGFPLSFLFDEATRSLLRSPTWLAGCLAYSSVLLGITLVRLSPGATVPNGAH